ncbi:PREDICTED: proline-rich proteoglycan 2-like, partial [Vollenhovia emeryi]|uniref:proline-rich proteoglycan 2-like n=1 Tax=Vollenhovia emeryi TaxID=411798 RepID=UPI0005F4A535
MYTYTVCGDPRHIRRAGTTRHGAAPASAGDTAVVRRAAERWPPAPTAYSHSKFSGDGYIKTSGDDERASSGLDIFTERAPRASVSPSSELHGPRHLPKRAPEVLGTPARTLPRVWRRLRDIPPPGRPPGSPERGPPLPPSQPVVPSDPRLRQGPRPPPILGHSYIPWRLEPITSIGARFREQGTQVHRRVATTKAATQTSPQGSAELKAVPVDVAQQSSPRGTQGTSGLDSPKKT